MLFYGIALALVCLVFWSVSDLLIKISLNKQSKWKTLFFAQLFGGLTALAIALATGEIGKALAGDPTTLLALGAMNFVTMFCYYEALNRKGLALSSPISNSWPIVTIALGVMFYREILTSLQIAAVLFIIAGIFITTLKKKEKLIFDSSFVFGLVSMLSAGTMFFLIKNPTLIFGPLVVAAVIKLTTSLVSLPFSIYKKIELWHTSKNILLILGVIGALEGLGLIAYGLASSYAPVSTIGLIAGGVPVLTVLLGVVILKEQMDKQQKIGVAATLIGILLAAV
ncbi:MAG: DMT family transporter [Candidatus Micrarchaeota archaeon]|nr:DMT family transporter [Candidatus Micrarchaeota archaeon]